MSYPQVVRAITEREIQDFQQNGWVFIKDYIQRSFVDTLLSEAKRLMKVDNQPVAKAPGATPTINQPKQTWWQNITGAAGQSELFRIVGHHEQTGRNIEKLFRRKVGVRYWIDNLACKLPVAWGGSDGPTTVHQDAAHYPVDRSGTMTCWIALDDIEPTQGSMRFYEGSHREELFGDPSFWQSNEEILEVYPWIRDYRLSDPLTYRPGDATFHHCQVVHGAPANTAQKPRWNYATSYVASDARYNGASCPETDNLHLEINQPITHPSFPLIWQSHRVDE